MGITILRIIGVWLTMLTVASLIGGGADGFVMVFMLAGFFMTVPALILLAIASALERGFAKAGHRLAAAFSGIVVGMLVPVGLYAIAPNPENAKQALFFIAPLCLGSGILWSLTSIPVLFARREEAA